MQITVIGGGNIGTLMAAEMLHKGHKVTIYTSRPDEWEQRISVLDSYQQLLFHADIYRVTNNMKEALQSAEIVFVTMPAQTFSSLARCMEPYVKREMVIGIVPGSGGAEYAFFDIVQKGCILFGLQRVHSIARIKRYGESVCMLGRKKELHIGSIPFHATVKIAPVLEELFEVPCIQLPNYLCVTLTPSNPILHTTRLYSMFKEYKQGVVYPKNYLFYEEWNDDSSKILIDCDNELQELCAVIPLDLKCVRSLQEYYESHSVAAMTQKIRSIDAFKGLRSPMKQTEDGWIPDFESRYFTADFSYGLKVIKEISDLFEVKVPSIDRVWNWYEAVGLEEMKDVFHLEIDKEDFNTLYN